MRVSLAHPVFGQVVTDHTLLPHLFCCFGCLWKLCLFLPIFLLLWQSMDPLVQLCVSSPVLQTRHISWLLNNLPSIWDRAAFGIGFAEEYSSKSHTFPEEDLDTKELPVPTMLSLVPPSFSSVSTRSLSSSGRVCNETNETETQSTQEFKH